MNKEEQFALLREWLGCSDSAGQRLWFTDPRPGREIGLHFHWRRDALNPRNGYVVRGLRWRWKQLKHHEKMGFVDYALAVIKDEWKKRENALRDTDSWERAQGFIGTTLRGKLAELLLAERTADSAGSGRNKSANSDEHEAASEGPRDQEDDEADSLPSNDGPEGQDEEDSPDDSATSSEEQDNAGQKSGQRAISSPVRSAALRAELDVTDLCQQIMDRFADYLRERKARSLLPLLLCLNEKIECVSLLDTLRRKQRYGREKTGVFGEDRDYDDIAACAGGMVRGTIDKYKNRLRDHWETFSDILIASPADPVTQAIFQCAALLEMIKDPYGREPRNWKQGHEDDD